METKLKTFSEIREMKFSGADEKKWITWLQKFVIIDLRYKR